MTIRNARLRRLLAASVILAAGLAALYASMGRSFGFLAPGYAQHLYGVSSLRSTSFSLGGVVVLQDGTVISAECRGPQTKLHIFDPDPSTTFTKYDTLLHKETTSAQIVGGCGLAFHNVAGTGYLFSNLNDTSSSDGDGTFGVARIAWPSLSVTKMAANFPGNGLGIAVDPQSGDLIYAGVACRLTNPLPPSCPLYRLNPSTGAVTTFASLPGSQLAFIDGIAFEPTRGDYLFITNRTTTRGELDVVNRSGQVVSRTPLIDTATTGTDPVGIGFHGSPSFVASNNQDGTMTEYDYPGGYEVPGIPTRFAAGGSRGDMIQAGPDGCLYVTQLQTVYNDPTKTDNFNSIVQICGGFVPPPDIIPNPPPSPSSLCGFVYSDANNNGTRDGGEAAIGGVTINLTGSDYLDFPVSASTTTSSTDGSYCFNSLQAGTYTISEVQPGAYLDGKDTQGAPGNGTIGSDSFNNIALAAGYNGNNNNFGELKPSSLSGFVYEDKDNDGKVDSGEPGIANVTVTLTGTDDRGASVTMPGATGSDGAYSFAQRRPGSHTIPETQPAASLHCNEPLRTPGGGAQGHDAFSGIPLNAGVDGKNNNFGELAATPAITLLKKTNGTDNTLAPGLYVPAGSVVTWDYILTNSGNDPLSAVVVSDDKVGAITCPATTLDVGLSMTCTAKGTAIVGQYTNVGTATAQDAFGTVVTATNSENYFGALPGIAITKTTNGTDNNAAPGPTIAAGATVTWNYLLTNTGNVTLSNVAVTDDKAGAVTCASKTLAAGASMTCTKAGTAVAGQYTNIGTVTGVDPTGAVVH